jgi:hypothetical protein
VASTIEGRESETHGPISASSSTRPPARRWGAPRVRFDRADRRQREYVSHHRGAVFDHQSRTACRPHHPVRIGLPGSAGAIAPRCARRPPAWHPARTGARRREVARLQTAPPGRVDPGRGPGGGLWRARRRFHQPRASSPGSLCGSDCRYEKSSSWHRS